MYICVYVYITQQRDCCRPGRSDSTINVGSKTASGFLISGQEQGSEQAGPLCTEGNPNPAVSWDRCGWQARCQSLGVGDRAAFPSLGTHLTPEVSVS